MPRHFGVPWYQSFTNSNGFGFGAMAIHIPYQMTFWTRILFFHSVGNVIIPTDELIFFRGAAKNHQPALNGARSYFKSPQLKITLSRLSHVE
jgi:hypothetical protein